MDLTQIKQNIAVALGHEEVCDLLDISVMDILNRFESELETHLDYFSDYFEEDISEIVSFLNDDEGC